MLIILQNFFARRTVLLTWGISLGYARHVVLPGTPEHHGTFRNNRKNPEHPQENPEHSKKTRNTPRKPGTPQENQEHPQENAEHLRKTVKVQNLKELK